MMIEAGAAVKSPTTRFVLADSAESGCTDEARFSSISTVLRSHSCQVVGNSLVQPVPECFKQALPYIRKLTKQADFEDFKS